MAIKEGDKMGKFIPLSIPNFEGNEKKYVNDAIEQGWVSTGGRLYNEAGAGNGKISSY